MGPATLSSGVKGSIFHLSTVPSSQGFSFSCVEGIFTVCLTMRNNKFAAHWVQVSSEYSGCGGRCSNGGAYSRKLRVRRALFERENTGCGGLCSIGRVPANITSTEGVVRVGARTHEANFWWSWKNVELRGGEGRQNHSANSDHHYPRRGRLMSDRISSHQNRRAPIPFVTQPRKWTPSVA